MTIRPLPALFAALACVSAPATAVHAQTAANQPNIMFDQEARDLGNVKYGGNGSGTFTFVNSGKTPLIITNITSSCVCLSASWPKEPIAPGARGEISFRYDTKRPGPISKTLSVSSNAGNKPVFVLRVKGVVAAAPDSAAGPVPAK